MKRKTKGDFNRQAERIFAEASDFEAMQEFTINDSDEDRSRWDAIGIEDRKRQAAQPLIESYSTIFVFDTFRKERGFIV